MYFSLFQSNQHTYVHAYVHTDTSYIRVANALCRVVLHIQGYFVHVYRSGFESISNLNAMLARSSSFHCNRKSILKLSHDTVPYNYIKGAK